jgi:hypothetical protein
MTADYSRWPTRPGRDYAAVRLQQGRVLLDSDWNEQAVITERRERMETIDSLGTAVVPLATPDAFLIKPVAGPALDIGIGRAYLDGLIVENHGSPHLFDAVLAELVDVGSVHYSAQPWFQGAPAVPAAGPYAVYLKAWQRERSAIEDPMLIEQALGVDSAARLQTVWQVKHVAVPAGSTCSTPLTSIPAFVSAEPAAAGRLTTKIADVPGQPDKCRTPPSGGYSGLENQLYRVEIHRGGPIGGAAGATFKWSRDNATVASRVTEINSTLDRLVVERVKRDDVLAIRDGDWIEITDDERELAGQPGELRKVLVGGGVDETAGTVRLVQPLPAGAFPVDGQGRTLPDRNTRVRRWDQAKKVYDAGGAVLTDLDVAGSDGLISVPASATSVLLEEGIVVSFSVDPAGGLFRTGDHWLFAARTADASVELLDQAPPRGIHAHYAPLAFVDAAGAVDDCRTLVPPLGGLDALEYVAGDGQEATPNYVNPVPVHLPVDPTVGVTRGPVRVGGRTVRFTLVDAVGAIGGPSPVSVTSGLDGLASVPWDLDPGVPVQRLRAELLDGAGQPSGVPVVFSARLRTADEVAYDPKNCGGPGGPQTVQAALDLLCARESGGKGCCEVVADEDDLLKAIERARERYDGNVCICLLPGDHKLETDEIEGLASLAIHGHGARIVLGRPLILKAIGSLTLADVAIVDDNEGFDVLLDIRSCPSLELDDITASLVKARPESVVIRVSDSPTIRIHDSQIANGQPGDSNKIPRDELPVIIVSLLDLADRNPTPEEAAPAFQALLAQPLPVREAAANDATTLAELRRDAIGIRASRTLASLGQTLERGEAVAPAQLTALLERSRRFGDSVERRQMRVALALMDGGSDAWIHANRIDGACVIYGDRIDQQPILGVFNRLKELGGKGLPLLPDGVGRLRFSENTVDQLTLDADIAKRLHESFPNVEVAREIVMFRTAVVTGNTSRLTTLAFLGEAVAMTSNVFSTPDQDGAGFIYANAATVTANVGAGTSTTYIFAAGERAVFANVRMSVLP